MATKPRPEVAGFLAGLPDDRRAEVVRLRDLIRKNLPAGYEEAVVKRMLVYQVPLSRYPDTYNGHPLWYVALASEKSYLSLHLMSIYADAAQLRRLKDGFKSAGKKLDMGKACIHFQRADDLPLEVIGALIAAIPVDEWIAIARSARRR
jgi:uncharacterized protein DUF1801